MERVQILYSAIRQAIIDYEDNVDSLKGKVVSNDGKGANRYRLTLLNTFETALVEKIVISYLILADSSDETVGWEVNYPSKAWGKLDLGLGPVDEDRSLFETVVEVKKWKPQPGAVPYNIWRDIFKLCMYSSEGNPKAGQNRLMLLFFETECILSDPDVIKKTFLDFAYLKEMKNDPRVVQKFSSRYSGKDLDNDYWFFHYFLSVELKWRTGIEDVLRTLRIEGRAKPFLDTPLKTKDSNGLISGRRTSAAVLRLLCQRVL